MHKAEIRDLRRLMERADLLLQKELPCLRSFWNDDLNGFHTSSASKAGGKINLTATCFCLLPLCRSPDLLGRFITMPGGKLEASALDNISETIARLPWTSEMLDEYNIYTTPIVLRTLYQLLADRSHGNSVKAVLEKKLHAERIQTGLKAVLKATQTSGAGEFPPYEPNAYLTYWCFEALRQEAVHSFVGGGVRGECEVRARTLADWGEAELYRQLAFESAGDMARFDPVQLAYALRIYLERKAWMNQPVNRKVTSRAVEVVFGHQNDNGLWPKSRPVFYFAKRGSVYPFTYEMLDVLLPTQPVRSEFESHISKLESSLRWAEDNYIDKGAVKGWRSNHLPFGDEPEGWSTAAVLMAVRKIRAVVSAQMNDDLLDSFRAQRNDTPDDSPLDVTNFYDAEVPSNPPATLKSVLTKYLIAPHKPGGLAADRRFSAVFYGPPGTAKTTLAMAVAKALGWPYIYLQTSDFAGEGVNQVIGKARDVFDRLSLLDRSVILFDEVEEFVRDRKSEPEPSSRMLTSSMLSLIQDLRSKKSVIFIVATNFLDKFDAAITRSGGRFDMMVLISPPSLVEKQRMFRDQLARQALPESETEAYAAAFDKYSEKRYDQTIYLFAFTEWKLAINEFIEDIVAKKRLDEGSLDSILKSRAETIALGDKELSEAYNASKKYVRF